METFTTKDGTIINYESGKVNIVKNSKKPKINDKYYFLNSEGNYDWNIWNNDNTDNHLYYTGNYFTNSTVAKKRQEAWQALARINQYIEENDLRLDEVDWDDIEQNKFYVYSIKGELDWGCKDITNSGQIIAHLKSTAAAEQLIENYEADCKLVLSELRFYT